MEEEKTIGFIKYNNINIEEKSNNYAKMSVSITPDSLNSLGVVHGGLIFTLADATMSLAAKTSNKEALTITSEIKYIKAGKGKKLTATANAIKENTITAQYKCEVYNDNNELCAIAKGIYYFVKKEE